MPSAKLRTAMLAMLLAAWLAPAAAQDTRHGHVGVWVQATVGSVALHLHSGPDGLFGQLLDHPFTHTDSRLMLRPAAAPHRDMHIFEIQRSFGADRPSELAGSGRLLFHSAGLAEFHYVLDGAASCIHLRRPAAAMTGHEGNPPSCKLQPALARAMVAPPQTEE